MSATKLQAGSCDWEENEDGWWNTDCGKTLTETPYSDDDELQERTESLRRMVERKNLGTFSK